MTRLLTVTSSLLLLFSVAAHGEHMRGAIGNNSQQNMMFNQNGGGQQQSAPMAPQMPDNSKTKEAAAKIIKDGDEIRKKQETATQKSLEGMNKSVADFSKMVEGFNKTATDDSSKELMKTIGSLGKSTAGANEAMTTAMDMIVNGFKEGSGAIIKAAQETAAVLANTKTPEVQRKPSSLDILASAAPSSGQNPLADAMSASSGKSDLIPKFGNNPIGYSSNNRTSYNARDNSGRAELQSASSGTTQPPAGEQQAHSAQ